MANKKGFIVVAMVTFCLVLTLFRIIPTFSSSVGDYDPWLDINDDGFIDGSDLIVMARAFGTAGDSTKNVNVTNFPPRDAVIYLSTINMTGSMVQSLDNPNPTAGYSRISLFVKVGIPSNDNYNVTLTLSAVYWGLYVSDYATCELPSPQFNITVIHLGGGSISWVSPSPLVLQTKGPYFSLTFRSTSTAPNPALVWQTFDVYVYLRNE